MVALSRLWATRVAGTATRVAGTAIAAPTSIEDDLFWALCFTIFLQNSGTSLSPFELHPTVFTVSVGCSALYYLAMAAKFMFPGFASQFGALMSVFGSLSAATLISLTLHLPWWSIFFNILFIGGFFVLLNKLHAKYANVLQLRAKPDTGRGLVGGILCETIN
ncbi:hypothetical protein K1719_036481 [Acacia pycnantha]|nr:hypothetical protein K1719_036481 [Acacia pycnantha]